MQKDTNPKDAIGRAKWRNYFTVPRQVMWALGIAMLEGALKYGRHNYRGAGVRASVYVDAALGHIDQWVEGEDNDPDSAAGLSHIIKAIASLTVLADAIMNDFLDDDRPPKIKDLPALRARLQEAADALHEEHKDKDPHHYSHEEDGEPYVDSGPREVFSQEVLDEWNSEFDSIVVPPSHTLTRHKIGDIETTIVEPTASVSPNYSFKAPSIESCQAHLEDPTYLPQRLYCLGDNDPSQILWVHEDDPAFDRDHIVEALTQKQIIRLMHHEAEQCGYVVENHAGDTEFWDSILRRVLLRMARRPKLWYTLIWANATDRRYSRLRGAEWQIAIPSLIDAQPDRAGSFA